MSYMTPHKEVIEFEARGGDRIQAAIDEAVEGLLLDATLRFRDKLIEFRHRWHPIDEQVTLQAPITRVEVELGGFGNSVKLRFQVRLRDPRNGHPCTVEVSPDLCKFV